MPASYPFTSECVTMGHPDKMADQISDAILDAIIDKDPAARVACETLVTTGLALVAGEITTSTYVEIPRLVRDTVREIGYTDPAMGFDADSCSVIVSIDEQSADIAQGVNRAAPEDQGAGDQGMMIGFACDETEVLMPLPIYLARRIVTVLADKRQSGEIAWLRPDGKSQVTVEYADGKPRRVHTVVVSCQHADSVAYETIRRSIIEDVVREAVPGALLDSNTIYHVNPTGRFVRGGPQADSGLTGRKIIADTYGGLASHGGGAFSGKDPSKVDRSAAYMMRHIAKNLVAAGAARRCELQIAYAIGVAEPVSIFVNTFGTGATDDERIAAAIREVFPLRPRRIIDYLDLLRPIYKMTARYGHFGIERPEYTWEKTNRADDIRKALGLG